MSENILFRCEESRERERKTTKKRSKESKRKNWINVDIEKERKCELLKVK